MDTSAADIEEAVDAVLQDAVLAAEQSFSTVQDPGYSHSAVSNEPGVRPNSNSEPSSSADQMPSQSQAPEGQHALSSAACVQLSPVSSAINPLFQPSQPVRPPSAQLQQTLSALTRQLSDLEASMQSPQTAHPSATDIATLSHRAGELCLLTL